MRRTTLPALALLLAACGGESAPATNTTPTFTPGHAPLSAPPANVVGGMTFTLTKTTLQPGEEAFPCFIIPLALAGPSHLVGGVKLTVGPGMHHGNVTSRPVTGEGFRPCPAEEQGAFGNEAFDILHGGAVIFGSSTQVVGEEWQSFPDGVAYKVKEGFEIVARMHYLNPTPDVIEVEPTYEIFTVDEALVHTILGPFAWVYQDFEIPPLSELTVYADCPFPEPMHVVHVLPHMHALGTAFQASFLDGPLDGTRFLDSKGYDPEGGVMVQYDPAVDLSQGRGARFGCTWNNTFDKTIVEGVGDNEMCILFGYAWPPEHAYSVLASGPTFCAPVTPPAD